MPEQVPITPVPLASPIQFYPKVITCAIEGKNLCKASCWSDPRQDDFLPFEVEHIWKVAHLDLSDRLDTDHHVPVALLLTTLHFCTSNSDITNQFVLCL